MRLLPALLLLSACAGPNAARREPGALLEVSCQVLDARVYVDDTFVGRADSLAGKPLTVRAGARRIEVRADGWFTAFRDITLTPNGRGRVEVELRPVPELEPGS
jgi:hypothetical protein